MKKSPTKDGLVNDNRVKNSLVKAIVKNPEIGKHVTVGGWVRTCRIAKDLSFVELNDGSMISSLQIVIDKSLPGYNEIIPEIYTGTSLAVSGKLVASPGAKQPIELLADHIEIVGKCPADTYPLQKKRHSMEFLRSISHLRFRTNIFGAVSRLRSELSFAVHDFFHRNGFVYLHSPIITTADCEGAGEMFKVTTLDINCPPRLKDDESKVDFSQDFFGAAANLTVSGQLEAEAAASALGNVYTFGPTFRAENSNTPRHLAEFWMIEPEMAFCDLNGNMELAERFVKSLLNHALQHCGSDLAFFNEWVEKGIIDSLEKVASAEFAVLTYTDAITALENSSKPFEFPVVWGCDLQTEHERYLTEEYVKRPVFIINYPKEIKSFYMRANSDGKTVAAMDLLTPRLGEIIGGSQREERLDVLEQKMKECDLDPQTYAWYLDLRRYGTVPHAGFGLGFERLLMYVSGINNIRDVIPFPRTPGHAKI